MITMRAQPGGQDGHCGNFNGDAADDTKELLQQRMVGQVSPEELLFPPELARDGVQLPPKAAMSLEDCPPDRHAQAATLCGVQAGTTLGGVVQRSCIFDVCFGGEEYAQADLAMDEQVVRASAPVSIHWSLHGSKCLDVGGSEPLNGSALQLWDCIPGHADMQFLLPVGGVGQIRWATYPNMCLDVSRGMSDVGTRVQIWECEVGHRDMQFVFPANGKGEIRWAADTTMCLDVRDGKVALGTGIQLEMHGQRPG